MTTFIRNSPSISLLDASEEEIACRINARKDRGLRKTKPPVALENMSEEEKCTLA